MSDEHFKPRVIVLACGDGNTFLNGLKWSSWSASTAKASGTYLANTCTPSCVRGHFVAYPAKVTLSQPGSCPGQSHKAFKRAVLTTSMRNARHFVRRWRLGCPIK
jgi:hypothetical protein